MKNKAKIKVYNTTCEWVNLGLEVRIEKLFSRENHYAFLNSVVKVLKNMGLKFNETIWEGKNFLTLMLDFDDVPEDYKIAKQLLKKWKKSHFKDSCCTQCAVDYWLHIWKEAYDAPRERQN